MLFGTIKEFKEAMREYEIKNEHNFKFVKNKSDKVMCAAYECPWLIYASLMNAYDKKNNVS